MTESARRALLAGLASLALYAGGSAQAADVDWGPEPDQVVNWSYALSAGATVSRNQAAAHNLTLAFNTTRLSASDRLLFDLRLLSGRSDGKTSSALMQASTRYERDIQKRWYTFFQAEYLRDRPENIEQRASSGLGLGYRLIESRRASWSLFAGLGYISERFFTPLDIVDGPRRAYARVEALIGTEADHELSSVLSLTHRLVYYPNLSHGASFRLGYEASAKAAISQRLSLDLSLAWRHSTLPGRDKRPDELLIVTGVSLKLD